MERNVVRCILLGAPHTRLHEAQTILDAIGDVLHSALIIALQARSDRAIEWYGISIVKFLEIFIAELPGALEEALEGRLKEVSPCCAKGAAHRTAWILRDYVRQHERQDASCSLSEMEAQDGAMRPARMENSVTTERLIRLPEVMKRVGLKRTAIYQRMREGRFPNSRSLGPRCTVWVEAEIDDWIGSVVERTDEICQNTPRISR